MARGADWGDAEVVLAVEDYFEMLLAEAEGRDYSKAGHRRTLIQKLEDRSDASIERKHQNISAILIENGIGPIDGYKPLRNYQHRLADVVRNHIGANLLLLERLRLLSTEIPAFPPVEYRPEALVVSPPACSGQGKEFREPAPFRYSIDTDFARIDQQNRKLGELGEQFVLDFEKRRLVEAGRDDLSRRVDWVSRSKGDGLGYDIVSFDDRSDSERLIEVKTTNQGIRAPFYISSNELRVSMEHPGEYRLYRVFRFSKEPRLFVLNPPLGSRCDLEPKVYRASF